MHHAFDPERFLHLEHPEAGYARYFASELESEDVVLVVAEVATAPIVGYAYGRLEPRSYNELLDACGKLHDIYVDESARGSGVGEALLREAMRRLREEGRSAGRPAHRGPERGRAAAVRARSASGRRCSR